MLTNKYDVPLNGASTTSLTVNIFVQCFLALIYSFLLWLMPFSMYVLLIYFALGQALTRFFYARALSRRRRYGPDLTLSNDAVCLFPFTAPIKLVAADFILVAAFFPVSLVACLLTRSSILPIAFPQILNAIRAVTDAMDVFTIVLGLAGTVTALLLRHSAAYRTNTIHRAPILTLSPTHLEFHPLLETAPVRIPWDQRPFLVNIDYPVVKRDTTKRAHITTTDSQTPTTIDITCLDLTYEQLQRLIGCFACRPQYRDTLATEGGIELVRGLTEDNPALWPR
ncbi:hypothetical protein [Sanguibacter keddieii]|uniref:hypothetical protein n=1 Tax=Sanguibacter keddieii TaxID=60920 RepID=UPI000660AC0E|nr:hypothetical protein [Sanguibacter keddieii]